MDQRTLKYIVTIAEQQNLTKAAEALYVGQPTLSKALAGVEAQLGLKLFRKVGRCYRPTSAGEHFLARAREILRLSEELDEEMSDLLNRSVGELNVAFAYMRCSYMLPVVLPAFQERYPNVRVNVYEGSSDENDRRLLDGSIELAFYSEPSKANAQIDYVPLAQEELLICARRGHPVGRLAVPNPGSAHPRLELSAITDERVLMMRPEQRTRQIVDGILREQGLRFDRVLCISSIQAIMGLVAAGYGMSFVFDSHLRHCRDLAQIDRYSFGEPRTVHSFVAAKRRGSYLSSYAQAFIETVRQAVDAPTP